jgi:hypothetical protein
MRFAMIGAAALLVAACAPTPPHFAGGAVPTADTTTLPSVEHRVTSWGRTTGSFELSPDGTMVSREHDFSSQQVTTTTQHRLTPAAHVAALEAIERLRNTPTRSVTCTGAPTDGPFGIFTWDGDKSYTIYYPCSDQFPDLNAAEVAFWDIVTNEANFLPDGN